jgi:hypothetical protein
LICNSSQPWTPASASHKLRLQVGTTTPGKAYPSCLNPIQLWRSIPVPKIPHEVIWGCQLVHSLCQGDVTEPKAQKQPPCVLAPFNKLETKT